jgi:hypothetical protein
MFNRKSLIMTVTLLVLLAAIPLMAAESGSAKFVVGRTVFVTGTEIQSGVYDVKWEPNNQEAAVVFTPIGKAAGIKAQGKIVDVDTKYNLNSVGIGKDSAGRDAILELQLSGKKFKVVFE